MSGSPLFIQVQPPHQPSSSEVTTNNDSTNDSLVVVPQQKANANSDKQQCDDTLRIIMPSTTEVTLDQNEVMTKMNEKDNTNDADSIKKWYVKFISNKPVR